MKDKEYTSVVKLEFGCNNFEAKSKTIVFHWLEVCPLDTNLISFFIFNLFHNLAYRGLVY